MSKLGNKAKIALGTVAIATVFGAASIDTGRPEKLSDLPASTVFEANNGKYVPVRVKGYESKADYPDEFWIKDGDFLKVREEHGFKVKSQ